MEKIRSLIVGATGLVGGEILKILESQNQNISLLSRTAIKEKSDDVEEYIINFNDIDNFDMPKFDNIFISIGTRLDISELLYIKNANRKKFIEVDYELIIAIAKKAFSSGTKSIAIVSAVGANSSSSNLYLKTKGELEKEIKLIGYEKVVIAQPGHLLGDRPDDGLRLGIVLMELGAKVLEPLMLGPLKDLRSIAAAKVASSMVRFMNSKKGHYKLKYQDFINS